MSNIYDDVYMRNLKIANDIKDSDYLAGETKTGTKLFPIGALKNFIYSSQVYKTMDDLKNAKVKDGDICFTMGYRTENDGGGGMYVITYDPTEVEDKGLVIDINTDNTLKAKLISNNNFVNIHHFGVYGDGVHDDTKFIQNALNSGMSIEFSSGDVYKITNTLKITKSNQVLNMNHSVISPYNCYAFSIIGEEDRYIENITFRDLNIRCANNGNGIKLSKYTKNISIDKFVVTGLNSSSKGFLLDGVERAYFENGMIYGSDYTGDGFTIKSSDSHNRNRYITIKNVQAYNCNILCKLNLSDETSMLVFDNCSLINDDLEENNNSMAFYIDGSFHHMEINNFYSCNADTFIYTSSKSVGNISIRDLYVYDNRHIFDLNSLSDINNVQLEGFHSYDGVSREPRNVVFRNMFSILHNNASISYDSVSYNMIDSIDNCVGKLIDHRVPECMQEKEYSSPTSTTLNIDEPNNASYNWTGDLVLKNINGFEGQIVNIRSSTKQEISSGGNIILYPENPTVSFKEAMKITPYKFKCMDGKWVKID